MTKLFKENIDVFKRLTKERIKKAHKRYENKKVDHHTYGQVKSINSDGSYQVRLNNSSTNTRCVNCCTAMVGDIVHVCIKADGKCVAEGRVGGDLGGGGGAGADWVEDFGEEGIWTWVKYASGRAECWGEWIGSYGSQIAADGYGYVDVPLPAIFAEREPAHITPSYQAYRIDKVYDNAEQMNDEGELVANVDYVRMLIWADGSSIPTTAELSFSLSVKGIWKELERPEGGGSGGGAVTYSQGDVSDWIAGKVFPYAGTDEPIGSLLCDGRAVSRREYWELFDAIGTTYGAGDGSSTFNLPNIESRTIIGESDSYALGATGGEEEHKLIIEEMPKHGHPEPRTVWNAASGQIDGYVMIGDYTQTTTQSIGSQGGDQPHNNMPPYIVMRYFITTGKGDPVSGINPADYVVEWGQTGEWTWRKYASGIAECSLQKEFSCNSVTSFGSSYSLTEYLDSRDYPFEFVKHPNVTPIFRNTNADYEVTPTSVGGDLTKSPVVKATRPSNLSAAGSKTLYWIAGVVVSGFIKEPSASGGTETIAPTIAERFEGIESDILDMRTNKVLWSGVYGMVASQTATLSEAISEQPNGIMLVFSWYDTATSTAKDWSWHYHPIPKHHVLKHGGQGVNIGLVDLDGYHCAKYLYVSDTGIAGNANNWSSATVGGVDLYKSGHVLRYVIGY